MQAAGLWEVLGSEIIPLTSACVGRTLAEPAWARISSPHYHAAGMDGFALRAAFTDGAAPNAPVTAVMDAPDGERRAAYVDTGDPLPEWADAVIPIENVEPLAVDGAPAADPRRPYAIRLRAAVVPWSNVRPLGEDMVATQLVLPGGHVLRPVDLGALAAVGLAEVCVARRPRVAVLPTGSELIPIGQPAKRGEIIEFNSLILTAQVDDWGGLAERYPIIADDFDLIQQQVQQAADTHDLVLLNAGSSAGSEDFSAAVVEQLGELLVHGVAVRPGHPVILGLIRRTQGGLTPIVGVPGYPVSATLTGEIFVEPLLARWLGRPAWEPPMVKAAITRKITSPPGDDDYLRVVVGRVGERLLAAPLARGSGVISSLIKADGIAILPRGSQGVAAGDTVNVRLYCRPADLERTIFAIGSHDMSLDLLAQFLATKGRRLASANVGSQGGLVALRRGEAHLAGAHLLDPATGEYNLSYIRQYLPDVPVKVVALVEREQGLLTAPGNPKGIHSLSDLARPEVSFVNRQRGAGTRVLLDYELGKLGVSADSIQGYTQEEYTHLAVAAAVASGRADCGLAIAAAADALHLDFIPLYQEHYELVVPEIYYGSPLLLPLWETLQEDEFRKAVAAMPGYGITRMGQIVAEVN